MQKKQTFVQKINNTFTPGKKVKYVGDGVSNIVHTLTVKPIKAPVRAYAMTGRMLGRNFSKDNIRKLLLDFKNIEVLDRKQDAKNNIKFRNSSEAETYVNDPSNFNSSTDYVDDPTIIEEFLNKDATRKHIIAENKPQVLTAIASELYTGAALNDNAVRVDRNRRQNNRFLQLAKITHSLESSADAVAKYKKDSDVEHNNTLEGMVKKYKDGEPNEDLKKECVNLYDSLTPDEVMNLQSELKDLKAAFTKEPAPMITLESVNKDILEALQESLLSTMKLSEFAGSAEDYKTTINKSAIYYVTSVLYFLQIVKLISLKDDGEIQQLCADLKCNKLSDQINNHLQDSDRFAKFTLPVDIQTAEVNLLTGDNSKTFEDLDRYTNRFKLLAAQLIYCKSPVFDEIVSDIKKLNPTSTIESYGNFINNNSIANDTGALEAVETNLIQVNAINTFTNLLKSIIEDLNYIKKYSKNSTFKTVIDEKVVFIKNGLEAIKLVKFQDIITAASPLNTDDYEIAFKLASSAFNYIEKNNFDVVKVDIFLTKVGEITKFNATLLKIFNADAYISVAKTLSDSIIAKSNVNLLNTAIRSSIEKTVRFPTAFRLMQPTFGGKRRTLKKHPKKTAKYQPRVIRKSSRMNKMRSMRR